MSRAQKDAVLLALADAVEGASGDILAANAQDIEAAKARQTAAAPIDRLLLDERRVAEMAEGLRDVARLTDPV
jgi:glutamate-5-semialdehyde dehydrogenase